MLHTGPLRRGKTKEEEELRLGHNGAAGLSSGDGGRAHPPEVDAHVPDNGRAPGEEHPHTGRHRGEGALLPRSVAEGPHQLPLQDKRGWGRGACYF